jgi:hypothetical protein
MTRKLPVNPAKAGFLADLKALLKQSGSPSYGELAAISKKLPGDRDLPTLSTSALSEILNGRRVGLPTSAWVASFVLSCGQYAWKVGKSTVTSGPDSLPEWQEKLEAAEAAAGAAADEPSAKTVSPDVLSFEPRSPDGSADEARLPGFTLTSSEADYVAGLGRYGKALLAELKDGNPVRRVTSAASIVTAMERPERETRRYVPSMSRVLTRFLRCVRRSARGR